MQGIIILIIIVVIVVVLIRKHKKDKIKFNEKMRQYDIAKNKKSETEPTKQSYGEYIKQVRSNDNTISKKEKPLKKEETVSDKIDAEDAIKTVEGRDINFTAFDFETATKHPTSACALGIAVVKNGKIVESKKWLIKPPFKKFNSKFIDIHGITYEMVESAPTFKELWDEIKVYFNGQNIIAHNLNFDIDVLKSLIRKYDLDVKRYRAYDTLFWMRKSFESPSRYSLDYLCKYFGFELNHHEAESDAVACAKLALLCCSLEGNDTLDKIEGRFRSEESLAKKKKRSTKKKNESKFIINQEIIVSFTSENSKLKTYYAAVDFISTNPFYENIEDNGITIYKGKYNTNNELNLRHILEITPNWKSRKIQVNDKFVRQGELTSALWYCSLTDEEIENVTYTNKETLYKRGPNMEYLIDHFNSIRIDS